MSGSPYYHHPAMTGWEGDFVTYAPMTNWKSAGDWIVPGTYRDPIPDVLEPRTIFTEFDHECIPGN